MSNTLPKSEQLITRKEAAGRIGVSVMTIDRALRDDKLTRYRAVNSNRVRVDVREVDALMAFQPAIGPAARR